MEALNTFINNSLSKCLIYNLAEKMRNKENRCLAEGFFCGGVVVAVFVAPVEAIVRLALAIITSIALIGYYVGGDTGTKFAKIPVKFFETALKSTELSVEFVKGLFATCLDCVISCCND